MLAHQPSQPICSGPTLHCPIPVGHPGQGLPLIAACSLPASGMLSCLQHHSSCISCLLGRCLSSPKALAYSPIHPPTHSHAVLPFLHAFFHSFTVGCTCVRIASHRITSHHITSHHITSHHITSHHITSHHITPRYLTSHHITSSNQGMACEWCRFFRIRKVWQCRSVRGG